MSDILDVLNIKSFPQKKGKETQQQQQQTSAESRQIYTPDDYATSTKRRKLSAMNRELYNLIGSNVPSLAIDTASVANAGSGKKFKEKLVSAKQNAPWKHIGFKNSARPDGLVLYHWTKSVPALKSGLKISEDDEAYRIEERKEAVKELVEKSGSPTEPNEEEDAETQDKEIGLDPNEYRYAKYNTSLDIPTFTEEEYEEAMKVEAERKQKDLEAKLAKEQVKLEKEKEKASLKKQESKSASVETPQPEKIKVQSREKEVNVEEKQDNENTEKKKEENGKATKEGSTESDAMSVTETSVKTASESNAEEDVKEEVETNADDKDKKMEEKIEEKVEEKTEEKAGEKIEKKAEGKVEKIAKKEDSENVEEPASEEVGVGERTWTYEETRFLFDLCSKLDMRWAVIFDRYQDKYTDRTVEDLKVQMYTISAHLLEKKGNLNDSALIKALRSFNKDKELERKYYLTKLIHRAPTEIAEEESLVIEARKFELAAKKMLLERAQLLQLLDSPQSSASVQQYLTSQGLTQLYNSLMSADKSKKRKAEVPVAPLLGPNAIPHTQHLQMSSSANNSGSNGGNGNNNGNGGSVSGNKRRSNAGQNSTGSNGGAGNGKVTVSSSSSSNSKPPSKLSEVQQLLQKSLTAEELEVYGIEIHNERIQPGVHVRSQKIASFKPSVQAKVHEILGQLGLSIKPTMPTGPVSKKFDDLLYKISHLVDLKKQSDKLLAEIELIKRQKGLL
ncbi:hypothetical protein PMKS-000586 [Pichia membranifaciens]|uniref:SWR1-complex protein 4 n=1 Tax=Pichia membranifaciens TaxID=4926 RepID=A0A1Q2YC67_9ASCO|nr:hypothetical protein PMKS-000586 [Pichia membranifaciens]